MVRIIVEVYLNSDNSGNHLRIAIQIVWTGVRIKKTVFSFLIPKQWTPLNGD